MRNPQTEPKPVKLSDETPFYAGSRGGTERNSIANIDDINDAQNKMTIDENQVKMITCGRDHSIVLTVQGKIYGFGSNLNG